MGIAALGVRPLRYPQMPDATSATPSVPWFAVSPGAEGSGMSITNQRTALNEQINGVANDLSDQSDDTVTALNAILTAMNAKPSA